MPDDVKDKIAGLEKELYGTGFKTHKIEDTLTRKEPLAAPSWNSEKDEANFFEDQARRHRTMKNFVLISMSFFILASAVAGFIWWRGANIVSGDRIEIDPIAPLTITGGEPFETKFMITNNNKVSVDEALLLVEYPVGFYAPSNKAELPRVSKDLGSIAPGQAVIENIATLLYGQENTSKEISVTLEYRMAGSNATLKKTKMYAVKILSSPINISLQSPKEISSGQEVDFSIVVTSNNRDPLDALAVSASYPAGFSFISSDPAPSFDINTWSIPMLMPQEKRIIKIRGVIEGQEGEEKATKISVGTKSPQDERYIGVIYNATTESSTIVKPVLGLDIGINGNHTQNNVSQLGKIVRVDVGWQNNNPTKVTDAVIEVKLKGGILDRYSIYASGGGFYRSLDNTIVWDKMGARELASMDPGSRGIVSFSFSPVSLGVDVERIAKSPQIIFEVRARARRTSATSAPEDITTFAKRTVKFETDVRLGARGLHYTGPISNSGPLPPQAEKETTYTVTLSARSSSNGVSDTIVKTTLPIYVKWLKNIFPEGENIIFNENTNEVIWNAGHIASGGAKEASFQISFLPSLSQLNQIPKLTGDFFLTGVDDFTKSEVHDQKPAVTTYISSDPQFSQNQANVVN